MSRFRSQRRRRFPVTRAKNRDLSAIFLTHFHSDHVADVGEVISRSWILGRTEVVPVYGGPAIERIVDGFNLVYGPDEAYRVAHHGEEVLPRETLAALALRIDEPGVDGMVVYEEGGVIVRVDSAAGVPICRRSARRRADRRAEERIDPLRKRRLTPPRELPRSMRPRNSPTPAATSPCFQAARRRASSESLRMNYVWTPRATRVPFHR
jgi:hypothetical protein